MGIRVIRPSRARRYAIAGASVAIATAVKLGLGGSLGENSPFALFGLAILVAGALGGARSALTAGLLATLAGWYFFVHPFGSFALRDLETAWRLGALVAETLILSALVARIDSAREKAEEAADRVERLQSLTSALAVAVTPLDVAHATVRKAIEALGAVTGSFSQPGPNGELEMIAVHGLDADVEAELRSFPLGSANPAAVAFQRGQPEWVEGRDEYARRYPALSARFERGHGAVVALPLSVVDRRLGVMALGFEDGRTFSRLERQLLVTLASQAAQSFERAQIFADEVRSRQRLEQLNQMMEALSSALTRQEVVEIIVARGMQLAAADTCTLYLLEDGGDLQLIGERGVSADIMPQLQRITRASGNPVMRTIRSRERLWAETRAEYLAYYPALASVKSTAPRAQAFWSLPLVAEGAVIGLLGMGFYAERRFAPDERELVDLLARQCAQALRRAELLESERVARALAEQLRSSFETTLRSIGDAVIATDTAALVTLMNPVAEQLTGWSEAQAKGQPLSEVFRILNEHTRAVVENPVDRVLREGVIVGLANHTVLLHRDGEHETPIDDSGAPIRAPGGALDGVVLVFRDVSAKKKDEVRAEFLAEASALMAESLDYRTTLASVAQRAVPKLADYCLVDLLVSPDECERLVIAHVDPAKVAFGREFTRRHPLDPRAKHGMAVVLQTGRSQWFAEVDDATLGRSAVDADQLRSLRQVHARSCMLVPLLARGRVLGAMTFLWAETDRRYDADDLVFAENLAQRCAIAIDNAQLYAAEQHARQLADLANRSKDEFLAIMGHELRNPLAPMVTAVHLLRLRAGGSEDKELAVLERQLRHMLRLVEDLLDVSRVLRDKVELAREVIEIGEVVASAVEVAAPLIAGREQTLVVDVREANCAVDVDPVRMAQVFGNLLTNAAKYTDRGGKIRVSASAADGCVTVSVEDSGVGIEPELMPRLFELFSQGKQSLDRQLGGLGIGLAIASRLVKEHGGVLTAHSDGLNRGSRFTVALPRAAAQARPLPAAPPQPLPVSPRRRVLIVDDNEDSGELMALVVQKLGHETRVALEGTRALELAREFQPQVVFLDIGLPGMNGFEVARRMRQIPGCEDIPIVAVTGYARESDRQESAAAGFSEHFAKPIAVERLRAVIETA